MRGRPQQIPEEALLDAAAAVFLRDGVGATTAEIARRAGVSEGLLFYRYKTKDDLIAAVIERELQPAPRLAELVRDPGALPAPEALRELVQLVLDALRRAFPYVEIARASPNSEAIMRSSARTGVTPERMGGLVAKYFEAERARGRFRALTSSIAGRLVVGVCLDRVLSESSPLGHRPLERDDAFLRGVVDLLLHGAAAPAPAR